MSRVGIFTVFDTAAQAFLRPFFAETEGLAKRAFSEAINTPNGDNNFFRHYQDYSLFLVGWFDDQKGEITAELPTHIGAGAAFKKDADE